MSDDTHDHTIDLAEAYDYEDPVSQRAMAFCHAARQSRHTGRQRYPSERKPNGKLEQPVASRSGPERRACSPFHERDAAENGNLRAGKTRRQESACCQTSSEASRQKTEAEGRRTPSQS
jgi:hypothetical protein